MRAGTRRDDTTFIPRQRETLSAEDRADLIIYGRRFSDAPLQRLCQTCGEREAEILVTDLDNPTRAHEVCAGCAESNVNAISRVAAMVTGAA